MTPKEWVEILEVEIGQRWPQMTPFTDTNRTDWREALEPHAASDIRQALKSVRERFSSQTPQLPWVLVELRAIREARREKRPPQEDQAKRDWRSEDRAFAALIRQHRFGLTVEETRDLARITGCQTLIGGILAGDEIDWNGSAHVAIASIRHRICRILEGGRGPDGSQCLFLDSLKPEIRASLERRFPQLRGAVASAPER